MPKGSKETEERTQKPDKGRGKGAVVLRVFQITSFVLCFALLFLMYGPYKRLSDLYIVTAMRTSDHQYLAKTFYSEKYIAKAMARNKVQQVPGVSEPVVGSGGSEVELIELKHFGWNGYLVKAGSDCEIRFAYSRDEDGTMIEQFARDRGIRPGLTTADGAAPNGARAAINASGYLSNGRKGVPGGFTIHEGHVTGWQGDYYCSYVALDRENKLHFGRQKTQEVTAAGYEEVIAFGPLLILNGEKADITGNGGGVAPRTAIGQTADGETLLLVIDGRAVGSIGATLRDVQDVMAEYGAVNAVNLDGGCSTCMYYDGAVVNSPTGTLLDRLLPNAILIY